jgi:ADP-ribosylglycohydrolase
MAALELRRVEGLATGLALGDSLGLPVETLTAAEIQVRFGEVRTFLDPSINSYVAVYQPPHGACSDDVQLSQALFKAYTAAEGFSLQEVIDSHIEAYQSSTLGWGGSTRGGVKLLMKGLTPGSAEFNQSLKPGTGNGIPMKIAAMAAWAVARGVDPCDLADQVQQLCSLSHPTTMSVSAGLAQIAALHYCLSIKPEDFATSEFVKRVVAASAVGRSFYPETRTVDDITDRLSTIAEVSAEGAQAIIERYNGGSCYVYESLPFSLAFFLTAPHGQDTVYRVIEAGGDTDSNGAIVGALQGALHGPDFFPAPLVAQIRELPELLRVVRTFYEIVSQGAIDSVS